MACIWNEDKPWNYTSVHTLLSVNYKFREYQEIDKFLQYFTTTHPSNVNPFPGKFIKVRLNLEEPGFNNQSNRILTFLEKYGTHLRTCEIVIFFDYTNPPEVHQKAVEWLNLMPNLQNLSIHYAFHIQPNIVSETQLEVLPPKPLKFLRKLVVKTFKTHRFKMHTFLTGAGLNVTI